MKSLQKMNIQSNQEKHKNKKIKYQKYNISTTSIAINLQDKIASIIYYKNNLYRKTSHIKTIKYTILAQTSHKKNLSANSIYPKSIKYIINPIKINSNPIKKA